MLLANMQDDKMTLTIAAFPISMFHMSANFSVTADKSTQHLSAEKKNVGRLYNGMF